MSEIQDKVNAWRRSVVGDNQRVESVLLHLRKEVNEFDSAFTAGDLSHAAEEAADVLVLLLGISDIIGFDLIEEVEKKLVKLKSRKWLPPDKNGVIEHDRSLD